MRSKASVSAGRYGATSEVTGGRCAEASTQLTTSQVLGEVVSALPHARASSDPAADLADVVDAWVAALSDRASLLNRIHSNSRPTTWSDIAEAISAHFRDEFKRASEFLYRSVGVAGADLRLWSEKVEDISGLVDGLLRADGALRADFTVLEHDRWQKLFNFVRERRIELAFATRHFRLLGVALRLKSPYTRPLTEEEEMIWDALDGAYLQAKEIKVLIRASSTSSVIKAIERIRSTGRAIDALRGRGYYRPDALPRAKVLRGTR